MGYRRQIHQYLGEQHLRQTQLEHGATAAAVAASAAAAAAAAASAATPPPQQERALARPRHCRLTNSLAIIRIFFISPVLAGGSSWTQHTTQRPTCSAQVREK